MFEVEIEIVKGSGVPRGGGRGGGAAAPGAGGRGAPKWASKHRGPGTIFSIGLLEPAGTIASAMKCTYPRKIHACIACNH
jgi:hypothetical protein